MSEQPLERQQRRALEELSSGALECRYFINHAWRVSETEVLDNAWIEVRSVCGRCRGQQQRLINRKTGEKLRPRTQVPTRTHGVGVIGSPVVVRTWITRHVNGQGGKA